jgi:putative ABC transport system permease protein
VLVVAQVAGCLVLCVVAGVFVRSADRATRIETGLVTDHVLQLDVDEQRRERVLQSLPELPGVGLLAAASDPPTAGIFSPAALAAVGSPAMQQMYFNRVSSGYFSTLGIRIVQGRTFSAAEEAGNLPVVILSQVAAERVLPGANPLGREVQLGGDAMGLSSRGLDPFRTARVIGVATDAMAGMIFLGTHSPVAYYPVSLHAPGTQLLLAMSGPAESERKRLDDALERRVPGAINEIYSLDQSLVAQVYPLRAASWVSSALGGIALLLTLTGIYGVMSYMVTQRTREIGIRMALGAEPSGVVGLVLRQSLRLTAVGGAIGLALALGLSALFATKVEAMSTFDPLAYGGSALLALAASLLAAWTPSRRAARVNPLESLREE